jgi:polysaccharide biosynthesis/export protein
MTEKARGNFLSQPQKFGNILMHMSKFQPLLIRALSTAGLTLVLCTPAIASVHAGDELDVTVYNHPELSGKVMIEASEAVSLPLVGSIDVRGLELSQIAQRIDGALVAYVRNPAVDVKMSTQNASIFVSGGPGGVLKYQPGEHFSAGLADVAALEAGSSGHTADTSSALAALSQTRVDLSRVSIQRDGSTLGTYDAVALSAKGDAGPALLPGDTLVFVDKPNAIRITGDVSRPGLTYLSNDETLADAVAQAGGVTATAATADLTLQRNGTLQTVALGDPVMNEPALNGDRLVVPTAPRVSVVGLVEKPGPVVLKTDFTLINALYGAGGPTKFGDLSKVTVIHNGATHAYDVAALVHGNTAQNPILADGDTVFVPEGHKVDYGGIFQTLAPLFYLFRPI